MRRIIVILINCLLLLNIFSIYAENKHLIWEKDNDKYYWYENNIKQGTYDDPKCVIGDDLCRGREIYDPKNKISKYVPQF